MRRVVYKRKRGFWTGPLTQSTVHSPRHVEKVAIDFDLPRHHITVAFLVVQPALRS